MTTAPVLRDEPDWALAAQRLVDGLVRCADAEARVWLLYEVASDLGAPLYPALVRTLCAVERFGDAAARHLVCDTLAYAARSFRAPPGRIGFWGGAEAFEVGPIEYLIVWHAQQPLHEGLTAQRFKAALRLLLDLVCATPNGRAAQAAYLREAATTLPGMVTEPAATLLRGLGEDLEAGVAPGPATERLAARAQGLPPGAGARNAR